MTFKIANDSNLEMVPVEQVKIHPRNPRKGKLGIIKESMEEHGFYGAVYVQRSTGHIVVGNHRYRVAKSLGAEEIPVIWLEIDDEPGPDSLRGYIERNSIALLSNYHRSNNPIDPPSESWLGQWAKSGKVKQSGLWNSNHVDENFNENLFEVFESLF